MLTLTIHGAHASPDSFNAIRPHLGDTLDLSYDVAEGFDAIVRRLHAQIDAIPGALAIVAHSLGGNLALHIADQLGDRVRGVVSLCSPFGGSIAAAYVPLIMPFYHRQLMRDIEPHSGPITRGRQIKIRCPWTQVVALNDRVVSQQSAESRDDMTIRQVRTTHVECLLNAEVIEVIRAERAGWGSVERVTDWAAA